MSSLILTSFAFTAGNRAEGVESNGVGVGGRGEWGGFTSPISYQVVSVWAAVGLLHMCGDTSEY